MSTRAQALAGRVEQGARQLAAFVDGLSDAQWRMVCPEDGRPVGVLVHHVASAYQVEIDLVRKLASGEAITGVTWAMVDQMNAAHGKDQAHVTKAAALELLRRQSGMAASAIRALSDEQLDRAAPVSLNWDAPLTAQYFIEEHPLGHSFHHLANIKAAVA